MNPFRKVPVINKELSKIKRKLKPTFRKFGQMLYKDNNIYLIYTMGKVGSSTIYYSLQKERPFSDTFHAHFLSDNRLFNIIPKGPKEGFWKISVGEEIRDFIKKNPYKRLKVITLTREPVVRSISDLFQDGRKNFDRIEEIDNKVLKKHIETLDYEYVLGWFDDEFKEYLNFDIYSRNFDPSKGYEIYVLDHADVLCLKLERLNDIGEKALKEFLGFELRLLSANQSTEKVAKDKYLYLKEHVKLEVDKLDQLYSSKYVQHFYSNEEISKFKEKWSK